VNLFVPAPSSLMVGLPPPRLLAAREAKTDYRGQGDNPEKCTPVFHVKNSFARHARVRELVRERSVPAVKFFMCNRLRG
jgi:hypothetical protein